MQIEDSRLLYFVMFLINGTLVCMDDAPYDPIEHSPRNYIKAKQAIQGEHRRLSSSQEGLDEMGQRIKSLKQECQDLDVKCEQAFRSSNVKEADELCRRRAELFLQIKMRQEGL